MKCKHLVFEGIYGILTVATVMVFKYNKVYGYKNEILYNSAFHLKIQIQNRSISRFVLKIANYIIPLTFKSSTWL